jgi:hypothetical protein
MQATKASILKHFCFKSLLVGLQMSCFETSGKTGLDLYSSVLKACQPKSFFGGAASACSVLAALDHEIPCRLHAVCSAIEKIPATIVA